ncbi:TIGR00153 family protein [Biformimicrobium ophioploci]|uniref:TIGR00153 family protein n=1 Tax=Biformimicrobium ophioploci TaxID=3036711 RepID=A0ABQ6M0L5_9GAMM|nr:TIGR00153 family protein [Microbulbifer sp. NKW57]GMG87872.1 TIGR00153 family protein [Microbulbifer sp. NKW57]
MPLSNIANLFGRSPIKPIEEHMALVHKASEQLADFFAAVIDDDWDKAAKIQQSISAAESAADDVKKNIRLHLPKSLFMPVSRSDLLELLAYQDEIADIAEDIAGLMLGRKMQIPAEIQDMVKTYVQSAIDTSAQALKAINELDDLIETGFGGREMKLAEEYTEVLGQMEEHADDLQVEVRAAIFKLEKDLNPIDVIFLYRIVEWIGYLTDRAHSVGNRLQLLLAH